MNYLQHIFYYLDSFYIPIRSVIPLLYYCSNPIFLNYPIYRG